MRYLRLLLGIIFLSLLASMMIYETLEHDTYDPDINYIHVHFDQYNNTQVFFTGEITQVNSTTNEFTLLTESHPEIQITVTFPSGLSQFQPGDMLEVKGILVEPYHVVAEEVLHFERWKYDLIFLRSLPAIPVVFYVFFRTWRFDWKVFRFQRRNR